MRIIVIGAVAAGTSAAAKARRNNEEAEIIIYEKDSVISYSVCGMPYFIGGKVENAEELTPRNPAFFKSKYNIDVFIHHEVLSIHTDSKTVTVKDIVTDRTFTDHYDKLVIATGASSIMPSIIGLDKRHVFTLRNINDMIKIKEYIHNFDPKSAVVVGTGFIGLEVCENLRNLDMDVTLIERLPQIAPSLDKDMAVYLEEEIDKNGVTLYKDVSVTEITDNSVILSDGKTIHTDLVILATGVRPNTELAVHAGIKLGDTKAIQVDEKMRTNIEDIYACGDCSEQFQLVTGKAVYRPMGSTANKTGRIAGDSMTGGNLSFRGVLGTGIYKFFDLTVAQTGLSEKEAKSEGYDVVVCHNIKPNKPEYMGGKEMVIKGIAEKESGRLLGAQIIGYEGVDKRIDVFVTAISFKAKAEDLFHLDLAYAPPFSTTKDPVMYTGMILDNAINHGRQLITADELEEIMQSKQEYLLIDARVSDQYEKEHVVTAQNIPHSKLRDSVKQLNHNVIAVTYCNKGVTGNAAQNILLHSGFQKVYNLSGGLKQFKKENSKKKGDNYE